MFYNYNFILLLQCRHPRTDELVKTMRNFFSFFDTNKSGKIKLKVFLALARFLGQDTTQLSTSGLSSNKHIFLYPTFYITYLLKPPSETSADFFNKSLKKHIIPISRKHFLPFFYFISKKKLLKIRYGK